MTIVAGLRKQRDDNYGTSSLSELASALGAQYIQLGYEHLSDIDTPPSGFCMYRIGNGYAFVVSFVLRANVNEGAGFQLKMDYDNKATKIFVRTTWSNPIVWTEWKTLVTLP